MTDAPGHHRPGGFANVYGRPRVLPPLRYVGWIARYLWTRKPQQPVAWLDPVEPPYALDGFGAVWWTGHAGLHLALPGVDVLIDPLLPPVGRGRLPGKPALFAPVAPRLTAEATLVVISHDHFDHLDRSSVTRLAAQRDCTFVAPLGVDRHLRRWGIERVVALDWWDAVELCGLRLTCTPANHWSGRGLRDKNRTLWAGWVVTAPSGVSVFHAGDTGAGPHFTEIGRRFPRLALSALPIGAYAPEWLHGAIHLSPEEALDALDQLGGQRLLPVHWGFLDISDELPHVPYARLRRAVAQREMRHRVVSLRPGYG